MDQESDGNVPESAITLPTFLEKEKEQAEQGCNDIISANNCNIGKNDSGGGYIGGLMLTLLGSMAWIRRKRH